MNNLSEELAGELTILEATRANMLRLLSTFTLAQVNTIPEGFNNNLAWNSAHCLVMQKLLTYGLSGHHKGLAPEVITAYRKGSKPTGDLSQAAWDEIVAGLATSIDQLRSDLTSLTWNDHEPYTTSYGVAIDGVKRGVRFNNAHEGMHYGVMLAISRLV